jgi:hypothetical protein
MDRDIEMEEGSCRIAQRLEFPMSDEEDLHENFSGSLFHIVCVIVVGCLELSHIVL